MILRISYFKLSLFIILLTLNVVSSKAQSDIKINGLKINHLDKHKKKQGEWIFFDKLGFVRMSCSFKDDKTISPQIFYENGDTTFIRLVTSDSTEAFVLYKNQNKYFGNFLQTSDTTSIIEVDADIVINETIIRDIKRYQNLQIDPIYFFAQKKIIDYISASFTSSNIIFNKPLNILLTINTSGLVTHVEFPRDKNNLSDTEERELHWIYSTMPRWQPFFLKNKTQEVKIMFTNNSTLSFL